MLKHALCLILLTQVYSLFSFWLNGETTLLSLFMDQTHNVSCFLLYLHVERFQYADPSNIQNTRTLRREGVFLRVFVLSRAFSRSQGFHEQRSHG